MKPKYRSMWMIPRNIRKIEPWKLVQIANLIQTAGSNSQELKDQHVQNVLYSQLADLGVKITANSDGVANPGGLRTYLAQLACLGLFWRDTATNSYIPTYAGEQLMNGSKPLNVLRYQLLRMQYPSVYGIGRMVSVSPKMKVKPFCFVLKLISDPRLGCKLSSQEIAVAVVYGRTEHDYEKVLTKILALREEGDFKNIIDSVDDLRTPRRYHADDLEDDLTKGVRDAFDIGNTVKNYLEAAQLIATIDDPEHKNKHDYFEINSNPEVLDLINKLSKESVESLDCNHSAAWQQHYGRYDQQKAVKSLSKAPRKDGFKSLVSSEFISAVENACYGFEINTFIQKQAEKWAKSADEIAAIVAPLEEKVSTIERQTLTHAALSGGKEAIVLEKGITEVFKKLGFTNSIHIGQRKAKRQGGFPDLKICIHNADECGLGDTKATVNYQFPLGETQKLSSYYHDCDQELGTEKCTYFLYIAGGFKQSQKNIATLLGSCADKFGRPVSAVTVDALLDLVEHKDQVNVHALEAKFKAGKLYSSMHSLIE